RRSHPPAPAPLYTLSLHDALPISNSPQAADVHARLADAYERAGNYGRALMHYRATPNPSPKRIAALEDKLADRMLEDAGRTGPGDRKSTRLNSSHQIISYAVFCLK